MWRKVGVPRTGQTATSPTTNYAAGDDGTYQAGVRRYATRAAEFIDNGNGTVFDRATGLWWVKQPGLIIPGATGVHATNQIQTARNDWANSTAYNAADIVRDTTGPTYWVCAVAHTSAAAGTTFAQDRAAHPTYWRQTIWAGSGSNLAVPAQMASWSAAVANCEALEYAGFSDWRMPNIFELITLLDYSYTGSVYLPAAFPGSSQRVATWSGTTLGNDTASALFVYFGSGYFAYNAKSTATYYCRPCRGGRTL